MNKKVLFWTVAAGAIGGFAANLGVLGEPDIWTAFGMATLFKYIVTPLLLGGLAAGIGVFVLTKTDTSDLIRTFFFAAICGLAFPEIIANARRTVSGEAAEEAREHALAATTQKLNDQLSATKPDTGAVSDTANQVRRLIGRVQPSHTKAEAFGALEAAATALPKAQAVELIRDVGVTAAASNDMATTTSTLKALKTLESSSDFKEVRGELTQAQSDVAMSMPRELRPHDYVATLPDPMPQKDGARMQ